MLVLHQFLCFVYTSLHFYTFSGTNLLTRCHSASSLFFLLFCISEKLYRKYSRNCTKQKPKILFYHNKDEVRRRNEEAPQGGHTRPWCGACPGRAMGWCGPPRRPPTSPFSLFIHDLGKNLNTRASIHEKFHRGRHR